MPTIYPYTFPAYRNLRYWKIGDTDHDPIARIIQQRGTSNPELFYVLPPWFDLPFGDKHLHEHLIRNCGVLRVPPGEIKDPYPGSIELKPTAEEWFTHPSWVSDTAFIDFLSREINGLRFGKVREDTFPLRKEQEGCVSRSLTAFEEGAKQILWDLKPRFGKTITACELARRAKYQKVLVLTWHPQVKDEWEKPVRRHVNFVDHELVVLAEEDRTQPGFEKPTFVFLSFQLLTNLKNVEILAWVKSVSWDLIILDEADYGMTTSNSLQVLNSVQYARRLDLTGTAFRITQAYDHTERWTLIDERKAHPELPKVEIYLLNLAAKVAEDVELNKFTTEEGYTALKFFSDSKWVRHFLNWLAASNDRNYGLNGPLIEGGDHMLWKLPDVRSCDTVKKELEKHLRFRDYVPIPAYDDNRGMGDDTLFEAKQLIAGAELAGEKSIILTCGKLLRGVTVPELTDILFLDDGSSAAEYIQTGYRSQSPWDSKHKPVCRWWDFNPNRGLTVLDRLRDEYCAPGGQDVQEFLDCFNVFDFFGTGYRKLDGVEFQRQLDSLFALEATRGFRASSLANLEEISNLTADDLAILSGLPEGNFVDPTLSLNEAEVENGKNFESRTQQEKEKEQKEKVENFEKQLETLCQQLPVLLYFGKRGGNFRSLITELDSVLVRDSMGLNVAFILRLLNSGVLREERLDRAVRRFKETPTALLPYITKVSGEVVTPQGVAEDMLAMLDPAVWSDDTVFVDPVCKSGVFLVGCYERMVKAGQTHDQAISRLRAVVPENSLFFKVTCRTLELFCGIEHPESIMIL